jgi:8-oxo-dGTP pyrophosphatase MutT (NUDIX family)
MPRDTSAFHKWWSVSEEALSSKRLALPYRIVTIGFIAMEDGSIISDIVRNHKTKKEDFVNFPGGGVDEGETPQQGFIRELLEETGVVANKLKLEKRVQWDWPPEWAQTDKQRKRYKEFRGEDVYIFSGTVSSMSKATSKEGDAWDVLHTNTLSEIVTELEWESNKKNKDRQSDGFMPLVKATLVVAKSLLKRK